MYAASLFNEKEGQPLAAIYGAVTTGNTWKFLKYENQMAYIDLADYYIADVNKLVGILVAMISV